MSSLTESGGNRIGIETLKLTDDEIDGILYGRPRRSINVNGIADAATAKAAWGIAAWLRVRPALAAVTPSDILESMLESAGITRPEAVTW